MTLKGHDLCCRYDQQILFQHLHFEVNEGELLWIEGANGSGKSSLLRMMAGLSTPHEGNISWQHEAIQHQREPYAKTLHYLGHANGIKLGLTVSENIRLAQHLSGIAPARSINETLALLQLTDHAHHIVSQLSAGQMRKVGLAKLFLFPKKIWIVDEPFTALDARFQIEFTSHLRQHVMNKGIVILSAHHDLQIEDIVIKKLRLGNA